MNKYLIKKGLFWALEKEGITLFYNNKNLRKILNTDDNHAFFNFLKFLTIPRLYEEIENYCVTHNIKEIEKIMGYLNHNKFIETIPGGQEISNKEKRVANFIGTFPDTSYFDYKEIADKLNFCVLGVGTAGSYTLDALFKMGFKNATLIDDDLVEEHNVVSQNFTYNDVGKPKVDVLFERYYDFDSTLNIKKINEYIDNFEKLVDLIDLEEYDYLLMFADDYKLTLEILENIFEYNSKIKVLLSGYSILEVESILITNDNYINILKNLHLDFEQYINLEDIIVENSGTILEAYTIATSTLKKIIDDLINLNNTEYMKSSFLTNEYFIGSQFEYLYTRRIENNLKKSLYNFYGTNHDETRWIKDININNIYENNLLVETESLKLDNKKVEYINKNNHHDSLLNYLINIKNMISPMNEVFQPNPNLKERILDAFSLYIEKNFDSKVSDLLKRTIENEYIYTYPNKFSNKKNQTILFENNVFVHNELNGNIDDYNMLIHEMLHAVFYFKGEKNTYDHETFTFQKQLDFLYSNKEDDFFNLLLRQFIYTTVHVYITNKMSLDYEKSMVLKNLNPFFNFWGEDYLEETINILKNNINPFVPFANYKYLYAIEESDKQLKEIVEGIFTSSAIPKI